MNPFEFPRAEARSVLRLALPIAFTQLGMALYGTVDMLFVGRLGPAAISAVGLGGISYLTLFVIGMGVVMGIDSHSSKAFGAGRPDVCGQLLIHTLVLSVLVAAPLIAATALAGPIFRAIGVDAQVAAGAVSYLKILRWAMFPALAFVACRQFLQSMSVTGPLVAAICAGNMANAGLDAALVLGAFRAPTLGIRGSAIATLAANFVMLSIVAVAAWTRLRAIDFHFRGWRRRLFLDVIELGLPAGLQMVVEVAVFAVVTALIGRLGAQTLAAHQLTLNLASLSFMVTMGLGHAAAARVGQALGRGDFRAAEASGRAATQMGIAFMSLTGLVFVSAPAFFLGLFGAGAEVIRIGTPLLYCGAAFQIFDGAQAVLTGALRGLGETRRPLYFNLIGHWLVGLPLGAALGFGCGWGATGLWIGLVTGLAIVAALLGLEWVRLQKGSLKS